MTFITCILPVTWCVTRFMFLKMGDYVLFIFEPQAESVWHTEET